MDTRYRSVLRCGIGFVSNVDQEVNMVGPERWHFGGGFGVLANVIILGLSGDSREDDATGDRYNRVHISTKLKECAD